MRKNKATLYATPDHKPVIVAALLTKYNVRTEVYCIGYPSAFYKTKDVYEAIKRYAIEQKFSKIITRCPKCFEYIAEQDRLPEQEHIYQCPTCGYEKQLHNKEDEI